jgi:hypothetical protein
MQNEEQLNKLFNMAKEQEVLLNSDEIRGLMNGRLVRTPTDKYQNFKTFKIKAMTISTLIIGIAATIVFYVNSNQKSFKKTPSKIAKTAIVPLKNPVTEIEEAKQLLISPPKITYTTKPPPRADDTGKKKKVIAKSEVGPETINTNSTNISFDKNTFVILTKAELKRLGIYIKDDVFMYEMENTRLGSFKAFFGDNSFISMTSHSKMENPNGDNPLAMFATTEDGDIKDLLGMFFNPSKIEAYRIASNLLPVWVEDETSKAGKPYIAWFEINDKLINLLPESIQKSINSNKTFYSHALTDKNKKKEEIKHTKQNIAIDKNQIIFPDTALLRRLGFTSFNPIIYHRKNREGELAINSNRHGTNMSTGTGNWDLVKDSVNTIFPSFFSTYDTLTNQISELDEFNMKWDYSQLQNFNNKKYKMVGLWLKGSDANKIFWYDINDAILNELNPEDKKRIKDYAEINNEHLKGIDLNAKLPEGKSFEEVANGSAKNSSIKTITLSEVQLAKLLIRVANKTIFQQIPIPYQTDKKTGKPLAIQIGFNKKSDEIKLYIPLDNFDSATYVKPVWLSDDLGKWAKASFDSSINVLEKISSYNLIPVLVKSGDDYSVMDQLTRKQRPDIIFWYEPTEKFLKILDNKTANEIRNDIAALTCNRSKITFNNDSTCEGKSVVSCNYFEACQNTKSKAITKYLVFPNPAKDNFNLKLDLKEECSVVVYIFALNGAELKQFPVGKMKQGISQKELSSDGITPGLYLLRITTDKGDVFNERILIKE